MDSFYPREWLLSKGSEVSMPLLDECLGTVVDGQYSYRLLPQCLFGEPKFDVEMCEDVIDCTKDLKSYSL